MNDVGLVLYGLFFSIIRAQIFFFFFSRFFGEIHVPMAIAEIVFFICLLAP